MTSLLLSPLSAVGLLLSGTEGAHGAATFLGVPLWIWQVVNLALFLGLLVWALRKPVATFFGTRREGVEKALKKAEEDRAKAAALLAEVDARVARLDTELAEIGTRARREAEEDQAALLREADSEAVKIVERARAEMDSRVRAARKELTAYAGDLAVEIARDILSRNVTTEDESRLRQEGIDALRQSAPRA